MARTTKVLYPKLTTGDPNSEHKFLDNISGSFTLALGGVFDGVFKVQQAYDVRDVGGDGGKWTDIATTTTTGIQPARVEVLKTVTDKVRALRLVTTTNITDNSETVPARCLIVYDEV